MSLTELVVQFPEGIPISRQHEWNVKELAMRDDLTPEVVLALKDNEWRCNQLLSNRHLPAEFRLMILRDFGMRNFHSAMVEGIYVDMPILEYLLEVAEEYSKYDYRKLLKLADWPEFGRESSNELGIRYLDAGEDYHNWYIYRDEMKRSEQDMGTIFITSIFRILRMNSDAIRYLRNSRYNDVIRWYELYDWESEYLDITLEDHELFNLWEDEIIQWLEDVDTPQYGILDRIYPNSNGLNINNRIALVRHFEDPLEQLKLVVEERDDSIPNEILSRLLNHSRSVEFTRYVLTLMNEESIESINSSHIENMMMDDELAVQLLTNHHELKIHKAILKNKNVSNSVIVQYLNGELNNHPTDKIKNRIIRDVLRVKEVDVHDIQPEVWDCLDAKDSVKELLKKIYTSESLKHVYVISKPKIERIRIKVNEVESLKELVKIKSNVEIAVDYKGDVTQEVLDILCREIRNDLIHWTALTENANIQLILNNPQLKWRNIFSKKKYTKKVITMKNSRTRID
jgi:hypothetical protein